MVVIGTLALSAVSCGRIEKMLQNVAGSAFKMVNEICQCCELEPATYLLDFNGDYLCDDCFKGARDSLIKRKISFKSFRIGAVEQ